ncbi:hypothetical protein BJP25_30175 [Actinokineospora bangkokensis]|uniref:HTH cro/C1-type domain-containing protein n=1 Tax=Actinokineospora bangkokensis TaxID=1193682 RepID=A0A1Q9LFR3_9PSEU|nr:hypothetical protein BJP25_30175 [Actinokineospora bangkokensis]
MLLARELDGARRARGYTTRTLAEAMSMSAAMLNRVMTGRRSPTPLEVGGLCALLEIPAGRRPGLYRWAATAGQVDWIATDESAVPLADVEAVTGGATWFAAASVPPPLRTPDYAAALGAAPGAPADARYYLHPAVLEHPLVPEGVLREQAAHLLDHLDAVRLVPPTVPAEPGFRVLTAEHFPPIVHFEHHGVDVVLERPELTARHVAFLAEAAVASLDRGQTRDALEARADRLPRG